MGNRLYVGNLPFSISEDELRDAFSADGRQVSEVAIITDRETGRPRGFAFVTMSSDADAKAAAEAMDGQKLGGRTLKVNEAQERRSGGGGGGGGRGDRGFGGGGGGGGGSGGGDRGGYGGGDRGGFGGGGGYGGGDRGGYGGGDRGGRHDRDRDFDRGDRGYDRGRRR
jgi:hypothetical protein